MSTSYAEIVSEVIRTRYTEKVMIDPAEETGNIDLETEEMNKKRVLDSIETSGWAPFHYNRGINQIAEPWRAHILWRHEARKAAQYMQDCLQVKSKEPRLAAACSALVLITWLPETSAPGDPLPSSETVGKIVERNEEHLAASAAMVQNFLLMLTAHGMGNYWSSGGRFRSQEMFERLSIPDNERLLAAVFIEYPEDKKLQIPSKERKPGAQRGSRSLCWIREVNQRV